MSLIIERDNVGDLWRQLVFDLLHNPEHQPAPRGEPCNEILNVRLKLNMPRYNIFVSSARNLQYRFMVAEWLWIWFGHDTVDSIERYNKHIKKFSDDGEIFTGAYGPRIRRQWRQLVDLLRRDRESRQAVVTIFDGIIESKDVPCTLSMQFLIRERHVHTIVNMRSSDVWLGLPYDIFNFTMISQLLGISLGLDPGTFQMNLGSSHLYLRDEEGAKNVLKDLWVPSIKSPFLTSLPPTALNDSLLGTYMPDLRTPWSHYQAVLHARDNKEALGVLRELSLNA